MTRSKWIAIVALTLLVLAPLAVAGEGKDCDKSAASAKDVHASKKCSYGTQDCLDHMSAKMKNGGWVGIELEKNESGVMTIQRVVPGSPAEQAGFQVGDVLFALNGIEINEKNEASLKAAKKDWKPGQSVNYTLKRDGRAVQANLTLASMPADVLAKFIGEHMLEHASAEVVASK